MSNGRWWHDHNDFYHQLLHSRRWRTLRKQKLGDTIWCEDCREQGRREFATEVHHLRPVMSVDTPSEMARLAFDYSNLRALCHDCHVARHAGRAVGKELHQANAQRKFDSFVERFFGD